ncbi:MAG TPA: CARDB domain-containing protein [Thermoleophilaceae bacterium]|nr:CARDB domain-containing protein [Thermoleophilaceae bacterium]
MSSRLQLPAIVLALLAFAAVAPGIGRAATLPGPGQAAVELLECTRGKQPSDRSALFRGAMGQLPDGQNMRMRFQLGERIGRGIWRPVAAPGLGVWHESRPAVQRFAYRQRIDALQKGTAYRVHVTFEWRDSAGTVLAQTVERSTACRQGGKLPNLHPRGEQRVDPGPTRGTARYTVQVRNTGLAVARDVEVRLRIDGAEIDVRTIGALRSGESRKVRFLGPVCRTTRLIEVDPRDTVREITERDNAQRTSCSLER